MILSLLVWSLGCTQEAEDKTTLGDITDTTESTSTEDNTEQNTDTDAMIWTLQFTVDSGEANAGSAVPYSVAFTADNGETIAADWTLQSDIEAEIFWSSTQIRPHISGLHTLTATAELEGQTYEASTTLNVLTADVYDLDLQLSDATMEAGDYLTYSVIATDRYGNNIEGLTATVTPDSPDVTVSDDEITSTVPGLYSISAAAGDTIDVEVFAVETSSPYAISLVAPATPIEVNQTLSCTISVTDIYGNITDDPWTMWTDGPSQSTISHNNVTFYEEGSYTIYAQVDNTSLIDTHGPIIIDSSGPVITVTSPERGDWHSGASATFAGTIEDDTSDLTSATLNGDTLTVSSSGSFSQSVTYEEGLNVIETIAIDSDGNESSDVRAVLAGSFWNKGEPISDGIEVHIGDNADGLGELEIYGEELIEQQDLASMLPGDISLGSGCIWFVCYSESLAIQSISYGSVDLDLSTSPGVITAVATINNPRVNFEIYGTYDTDGYLEASTITVTLTATPSISNNQLNISVSPASTSISGLNLDLDGFIWTVLDAIGADGWVEGYVEDELKSAIADAVEGVVPDLLGDTLQDLEFNESFSMMNQSYNFSGVPSNINVNDNGIDLGLEAQVTADSWVRTDPGLGSLYGNYASTNWYAWNGIGIAISFDVLNQLLYEVWGGGALNMEIDDNSLGIEDGDLEIIFPNSTDLRLTIDPMLPPVLVSDGIDAELQLGDLYIALHNGDYANNDLRLELYVSTFAPIDINSDGQSISTEIGTPEFYFDVTFPEANSSGAQSAEALMAELMPLILPTLTESLGEITLPDITGFSFNNVTSYTLNGHLKAVGDLELN